MNASINGLAAGFAAPPCGLLGIPRPIPAVDPRGFDPDAAAYINAVEAADGQRLETNVAAALNSFVVGCKADNLWTAIKSCCILMGARTLSGALVSLAGPSFSNFNFVSGDYDRKLGLRGNASNKYLNNNRANNADGRDDKHQAVYVTVADANNRAYCGSNQSGTGASYIATSAAMLIRVNTTTNPTISGATNNTTGFHGASRSQGVAFNYCCKSSTQSPASTSATPSAVNTTVFAVLGASPTNYSAGRLAFFSTGTFINIAMLESRVTALYSAIRVAI